jgi:hypothetical protein
MAPVDLREKEHRYLRHLIVRLAESRGFGAELQDMSEPRQVADLILKRDATTIYCLIMLSTTPDDEIARIKKCGEAGCSRVLVVSSDRDRRSRIAKRLSECSEVGSGAVHIAAPEDVADYLAQTSEPAESTEKQFGAYNVRVTRVHCSADEHAAKRAVVAEVIARSLTRSKR